MKYKKGDKVQILAGEKRGLVGDILIESEAEMENHIHVIFKNGSRSAYMPREIKLLDRDTEDVPALSMSNEQMAILFETMKVYYGEMIDCCYKNLKDESIEHEEIVVILRPIYRFEKYMARLICMLSGADPYKIRYGVMLDRHKEEMKKYDIDLEKYLEKTLTKILKEKGRI